MNTDKIAIIGDVEMDTTAQLRAVAEDGWVRFLAARTEGKVLKYTQTVGMTASVDDALPVVTKLIGGMIERGVYSNILITAPGREIKIRFADFLKAEAHGEKMPGELVDFTAQIADKLEAMGNALKISDDYVHPSTRGKSGIMQSMTLAALHAAFGADVTRPRPDRIYKGNNAATTLLGNIGRRKVGGKK